MTFDFFNSSNLAFGKKITQAFNTLNDLAIVAENHLETVLENVAYYKQYGILNYQAPVPFKNDSPVRSDEIFALLEDNRILKNISYDNGLLSVEFVYYDSRTHKVTLAVGSTELKEGYAFVSPSISNSDMQRTIRFSSKNNAEGSEILLFEFRINNDNKICLGNDLQSNLGFYAYDATQYRALAKGDNITLPYTANDYECICVVGKDKALTVKVDDVIVAQANATIGNGRKPTHLQYYTHYFVYLKPKQTLSGTYGKAFKVKYNY